MPVWYWRNKIVLGWGLSKCLTSMTGFMLLLTIWLRVCFFFPEISFDWSKRTNLDQLLISFVPQNTESLLCVLTHTCPMKIIQRYWMVAKSLWFSLFCSLQFSTNIKDGHKSQHKGSVAFQQMSFGTCLKWCWPQNLRKEINPTASFQ